MKKKVLAVCLPLLGAGVIVGAGFSAWAFEPKTATDEVSGTVEVTGLLADFEVKVIFSYDADSTEAESIKYVELGQTVETVEDITETSTSVKTGTRTVTEQFGTNFVLELDQGTLYNTTDRRIGVTPYLTSSITTAEAPDPDYSGDQTVTESSESSTGRYKILQVFFEIGYKDTADTLDWADAIAGHDLNLGIPSFKFGKWTTIKEDKEVEYDYPIASYVEMPANEVTDLDGNDDGIYDDEVKSNTATNIATLGITSENAPATTDFTKDTSVTSVLPTTQWDEGTKVIYSSQTNAVNFLWYYKDRAVNAVDPGVNTRTYGTHFFGKPTTVEEYKTMKAALTDDPSTNTDADNAKDEFKLVLSLDATWSERTA